MPWITFVTIHLLGWCLGAVVNQTPSPATPSPTPDTTQQPDLTRVERSIREDSVLEYLPVQDRFEPPRQGSDDYLPWAAPSAGHMSVADLTDDQLSWQLEPQVGKRPKRVRGEAARLVESALDAVSRDAANTVLARQQRTGRMYDVPQIGE